MSLHPGIWLKLLLPDGCTKKGPYLKIGEGRFFVIEMSKVGRKLTTKGTRRKCKGPGANGLMKAVEIGFLKQDEWIEPETV